MEELQVRCMMHNVTTKSIVALKTRIFSVQHVRLGNAQSKSLADALEKKIATLEDDKVSSLFEFYSITRFLLGIA